MMPMRGKKIIWVRRNVYIGTNGNINTRHMQFLTRDYYG